MFGSPGEGKPGWPWLGILLLTQHCGMVSVVPVSRDSLQQKPSDDKLGKELLQQGHVGWQEI